MNFVQVKKQLKTFKENNIFEFNKIMKTVRMYTPKNGNILDVGCGYGRYLKPLSHEFKNIVGVDMNEHIVQELKKDEYNAMSLETFEESDTKFDTIIMSHIIEHFSPSDLLKMMNFYLSRLKTDGYLIIATPTLSEQFYYDFDHIRPYYPHSIVEVFGGDNSQVQYYGQSALKAEKVWFRRSRIQVWKTSWMFNSKFTKNICTGINLLFAILYRYSFSLIGKRSGWIGVFRKV